VFTPISHFRYADFELNIAAGLEDSLIAEFDPPWNCRQQGQRISEEAEREEAEEGAVLHSSQDDQGPPRPLPNPREPALAVFKISLGEAYYNQGLINPGVQASNYLGQHGEPIQILFEDGSEPVVSTINRTANASGGVRVVGRNRQIAQWFQRHFRKGDVLEARVVDAHRILLLLRHNAEP
jgi:hypothetical protein